MKRTISILLILAALLLAGCNTAADAHTFHYLRQEDDFIYGAADGVIAAESRAVSDGNTDLNYLLRLYLEGPLTDDLVSPYPRGTYLLSTLLEDGTLTVVLSEEYAALTDMDLTLAGACLSATCFDLTDAEQVQIISDNNTYTYTRGSFTLLDDSAAQ